MSGESASVLELFLCSGGIPGKQYVENRETKGNGVALRVDWTEEQTKRALYLYFQLPFGQIDKGNREIIVLAAALGRTPSSVAMKLANFASLDPHITRTGRKGLSGASSLDRRVWAAVEGDWTALVEDVGRLEGDELVPTSPRLKEVGQFDYLVPPDGPTTVRAEIERRRGQEFFRRAVLANFDNVCCVTGIAESRLLVASHILPWGSDVPNRHNPRNGLCLSATFDKAFDKLLMTVAPDFTVRLSGQLLKHHNADTRNYFAPYEGKPLKSPTRLMPDAGFLSDHNARFIA
jgi:putative restriction endonuclease